MSVRLLQVSSVIIGIILWLSFSSNPPQGRTGAPGETTCSTIGCHSPINATINGNIKLRGLSDPIVPDSIYMMSVDLLVTSGNPARGGFQMLALTLEEDNIPGFSDAGENTTISTSNSRTYLEHNPAKNFNGQDSMSYTASWSFPGNLSSDQVVFYAAANFANGGGAGGDRIITFRDTFSILKEQQIAVLPRITDISCPNSFDGQIALSITGGQAPYKVLWNTGDTTLLLTNLGPGTYVARVTDVNEASVEVEIGLQEGVDQGPPSIICVSDTLKISSCARFSYPIPTGHDDCSTVTVRRLEGLGSGQPFDPGIHLETYEASDESGNTQECTIVIMNTVEFDSGAEILNIPCYEDSTGSITFSPSGTNLPINISHQEGLDLNVLPEGEHTVLFEDATGCRWEEVYEIIRPDSLFFESIAIERPRTSSSGDGMINITVRGGSPPYSFNWRTEDENFSSEEDLDLLFPGEYLVIVEDSRNCSIVSDTIIVDAITSIVDEELSKAIIIYPNPVIEKMSIETGELKPEFISIINQQGKFVMRSRYHSNQYQIAHLPTGNYFVLLELINNIYVGKQIIKL